MADTREKERYFIVEGPGTYSGAGRTFRPGIHKVDAAQAAALEAELEVTPLRWARLADTEPEDVEIADSQAEFLRKLNPRRVATAQQANQLQYEELQAAKAQDYPNSTGGDATENVMLTEADTAHVDHTLHATPGSATEAAERGAAGPLTADDVRSGARERKRRQPGNRAARNEPNKPKATKASGDRSGDTTEKAAKRKGERGATEGTASAGENAADAATDEGSGDDKKSE
jgi:hypothetical protein